MNLISMFCFPLCIGIVLLGLRRGVDVLSPGRVFVFVWSLAIGLTELKFSGLQHEWSAESWIQVLLGPGSFLVGVFVTYVIHANAALLPVEAIRDRWGGDRVEGNRLFWAICCAFALYLLAYGVIFFVKGVTPPLFSLDPGESRKEFQIFGLGLFLHNVVIIVVLTVIYHLKIQEHRLKKQILKLISLISVVTYFFLLQRFQLAMAAVVSVAVVYYAKGLPRLRKMALYAAMVVPLFLWVSTLRAGQFFIYYLYRNSRMKFSPAYAVFTEPYMYLVMNLENFARAIEKSKTFTFGKYTFDFALAATGLKHWIDEYFGLVDTPYLVSGYNTYTAFWTFYRDFGVLGIALIPLLIGMAVGSVYYRMRKSPSIGNLVAYGACVFVVIISFFNNPLQFLWFVYNMVAIYAIFLFVRPSAKGLAGVVD